MLMKEMSNEHFTRSRKLELDTPVVVEESIRISAPSNISKTGKKKMSWCPAEMMSLFRTELDMEGKIKYKTLMSMAQVSKVPQATYCKRMNAFVAAHNYNSLAALKRDIPAAVRVTKFSHDYLIAGGWTQLRAEGRVCYLSPSEELAIAAVLLEFSCSGTALTFEMFQAWVLMIAAGADQEKRCMVKKFSRGWFQRFLERHQFLSFREGKGLDISRKAATQHVRPFFERHVEMLANLDPRLLGNMDETMVSNACTHVKVIGASMADVVHRVGTETERPHVSLLPAVVASGEFLSALVIEATGGDSSKRHKWCRTILLENFSLIRRVLDSSTSIFSWIKWCRGSMSIGASMV